jgi:hypothetical protein
MRYTKVHSRYHKKAKEQIHQWKIRKSNEVLMIVVGFLTVKTSTLLILILCTDIPSPTKQTMVSNV